VIGDQPQPGHRSLMLVVELVRLVRRVVELERLVRRHIVELERLVPRRIVDVLVDIVQR
jgi:hypothetical protein